MKGYVLPVITSHKPMKASKKCSEFSDVLYILERVDDSLESHQVAKESTPDSSTRPNQFGRPLQSDGPFKSSSKVREVNIDVLHKRWGHIDVEAIKKTAEGMMAHGIPI